LKYDVSSFFGIGNTRGLRLAQAGDPEDRVFCPFLFYLMIKVVSNFGNVVILHCLDDGESSEEYFHTV
jgi:hypothetical protein